MISEYNNRICKKLVDFVQFFIDRVQYSIDKNIEIKIKKYTVIDTNNFDINYLTVHGMTGTFTVKIYFEVINEGVSTEFNEDIEIPKMINNVFVIDGALRIPTNTLDNDDTVTVYENNVRLNDMINIMYDEDPNEQDGFKLTLYIYLDEEPMVLDGTEDNFERYKEYLKLKPEEKDKIKVKLDTDDVGDYLTYQNVIALINLGADKYNDNMIDKKIYSPESNLMKYLWSRDIRKKILTGMKSKFFQYNRIYLRDIQNAINRYFVVASEKNIDFPSTVNPLIFDAMKFKVVIPKNVAYNQTMTDIIDVTGTPFHNNNCNKQNELNVCAEIIDDVIYIKCYTYPEQTPIRLPYTTYCTKKVVLNQYWDYENKRFKDNVKTLNYKLRLKLHEGTVNDKYDLIEPKADDKLSITSRRIPLGNMSDVVRVGMGTSMAKQAVELEDSEPSLVCSGHDDEDFEISTLITRFNGPDSFVEKIEDNKIFIRDRKTGSVQFYEIPSPTRAANDSPITFESAVKVGDEIKNDSILIMPRMFKRRQFELGLNSNVVYLNYLGYTHEDGIVISESYSDRLKHYSIIDVYKEIYPDDIITYIKKIGSKITSKDVLVNNQTRLRVSSTIKETYTSGSGLLQGMGISYNQSNLIVPNNLDEGYVLDVKIIIPEGRELTSDVTKQTIVEFNRDNKVDDYKDIPEKFKSLHANEFEIGDKVAGYISYKLIRVDKCKIGDKLTNRYGSKGIVSLVLPDRCMPQIVKEDGTRQSTEIVLNPASVLHRKNISQLYECALVKCIFEIYKRMSNFLSDGEITEARVFLSKFKAVYGSKFDNMDDKELIENHNSKGVYAYQMPVGFFSKVSYDSILEWTKFLGIKESEKIYCPDIVIAETQQGIKGYLEEEYKPDPTHTNVKHHDLGMLDQPCVTGNEYIMKLWKQASYDGKVTSELLDTDEPVMGRGKYRFSGQKIGEMELWVLLETGTEKFIQTQSDTMKTSQYQFINELLLSGYYIQDAQGNPILSRSQTTARQLADLDNE